VRPAHAWTVIPRGRAVLDRQPGPGNLSEQMSSEFQDFKIVSDHAEYRPVAQCSLGEAADLIASALAFARDQGIKKLLVVTVRLTGFDPPNVIDRYEIIHQWARASGRAVQVAVVARPEMIDPQKFGVTVAYNIGFRCDVFPSEEEALAWLKSAS
jgi:hypothetical protein